jgi:hypothetical protein
MDEVTGSCRNLHNEELQKLFTSPSIIREIGAMRMKWVGHVARKGKRNAYRIFLGKPDGGRPLGRPRSK